MTRPGVVDDSILAWLLEESDPAVRAAALTRLAGRPDDDPDVVRARAAALVHDPIQAILRAQEPDGHWGPPGPGYYPKYTGTVWQLMFLDQLGADPRDEQVQRACDYVLAHNPTSNGGLGLRPTDGEAAPPPSMVIHCLNGNLLRALIGFGRYDDPRVQDAVAWAATRITGDGVEQWYRSGTSGPGFACAANDGRPCAWGAVKEMLAFARIPSRRRTGAVRDAISLGVDLLLSCDPATATYPTAERDSKPSGAWFQLGFPVAYVTDVLQVLEALSELGLARDARLRGALEWVISQRGEDGRWRNRHAYHGKTTVDFEKQGAPSKWVTLRACSVLKAAQAPQEGWT
jgi:hypothetical protein